MAVVGGRVAVVGGSIAGCAAALALRRAGCEVLVYERTRGMLRDRGAGIAIPVGLLQELVSAGYLDSDMPWCPVSERVWLVRDGAAPEGRVLWRQPSLAAMNNWGVLWRTLRSRVPDQAYGQAAPVVGVEVDAAEVTVALEGSRRERFDLVVGADGYRSMVRGLVHPDSGPAYAGYVAFRGQLEESCLPDTPALEILEGSLVTVCFPGGHGVFYLIPGSDGRIDRGHRRLNWVIYSAAPVSFDDPGSVAPGAVGAELAQFLEGRVGEHFPPSWAKVVHRTGGEVLSIQPIYDEEVETYVSGRVALIGDAATVTRPHTASGATKALQDALSLERAMLAHQSWEGSLAAYDAERCRAGRELVELGRRIGRAQVEETPEWASMTPEDFDAWTRATLAGQCLYLYGNVTDGDRPKVAA
jgi:2-polyprenyl-6-methoxyphenol hydroxylase-like FAD-dependent oxidoreductase